MNNANPYTPPAEHHQERNAALESQFKARCALTGFLSAAVLPVGYGIYLIQQHMGDAATLAPGEAMCGSGVLLAATMICAVGPVLGGIGAASGWLAAVMMLWQA